MDKFHAKINNVHKLLDSISDESITLYLSKRLKPGQPLFSEIISMNDFSYFKFYLTHQDADNLTGGLKSLITSGATDEVQKSYKQILTTLISMLQNKDQDNVIKFHLLGLLKYYKGYQDNYTIDFLKDVVISKEVGSINKMCAMSSLLFISNKFEENLLVDQIQSIKLDLALENFFFNYLNYYYGGLQNAVQRLISHLRDKAPVMHMLYVIGDMVEPGKISSDSITDIEKLVCDKPLDKGLVFDLLNVFHKSDRKK